MTTTIKQFPIGPMQNFIYMIGDIKTKQAVIVDPAWDPTEIYRLVENEGFKLSGLLVSHAHYDHTNAIEVILQKMDIPVYAQKEEIEYSKSDCGIVGDLGEAVKVLNHQDQIKLGETEINFLHTPGHTPGSQCIRVGNHLITGDTLFIGGCGRGDLPGGNPTLLFQSLKKIATMPSDLIICPGHDYGEVTERVLLDEKSKNPFLQFETEDEFINTIS